MWVRVFKKECKTIIRDAFLSQWKNAMHNHAANPILRTYSKFKSDFRIEPYLYFKDSRHGKALSRLRASSHHLEIERGRHAHKPIHTRICKYCNLIEDEQHFLVDCSIYTPERNILFDKIGNKYTFFSNFDSAEKFIFLLSIQDPQVLAWLGRFTFDAFELHREFNLFYNQVVSHNVY